ncbi:hypothetical protein G7054_g14508 [Neopestalotiopsis clavispora]|nr:hypothetical protein G7054_g14508 [Neopestalotiopsis clavispora]
MELDAARHIRYFKRCYSAVLPHHYTANDSSRLSLGYFIVAGLDILSSPSSYTTSSDPKSKPPPSLLTSQDRYRLRKWVLSLQHRGGGFCGSPQHVFPDEMLPNGPVADPENANIAATYFALMLLAIVAEDSKESSKDTPLDIYINVNRIATLRWLKSLQRDDGSFGEILKPNGTVGGGRDMRYAYMAAVIRWVLGGDQAGSDVDFDVDKFVSHIKQSQTFDGGIAESAMGESHAGYSYCAVAALSMLDLTADDKENPNQYLKAGIPSIPALVHYLVSRQFVYTEEADSEDEDETEPSSTPAPDMASLSLEDASVAGFSGRPNKIPDTCYTWWVAGALDLLGDAFEGPTTVDQASGKQFLLEKTQHVIGGFGKNAGKPPDVYHAYLGLAALATMAGDKQEAGLGLFDVRLCIGREAANRVAIGRREILQTAASNAAED